MFRTLAAAVLAATPLVATLAMAQPQAAPAPAASPREPMTRAMVEQHAAAMFARLDANGDARLTPADRAARTGERRDARFAQLDSDGDGAISRAEFAAAADQRAEQRAEQHGGRRGEAGQGRPHRAMAGMAGPRGPRGGARQILARADADGDGDGAVTQAELASAMLARFDAADADRDGTIAAGERRPRGRPHRPATR